MRILKWLLKALLVIVGALVVVALFSFFFTESRRLPQSQ